MKKSGNLIFLASLVAFFPSFLGTAAVESAGESKGDEQSDAAQLPKAFFPELHLVEMKLSGSMCLACLRNLEKIVSELPGVESFAVLEKKPSRSSVPDGMNGVESKLVYDRSKVRLAELKTMILSKGYIMYKINDKPVASLDCIHATKEAKN